MKKTIIHTIDISQASQKVLLQIPLPRGTKRVEQIEVSTTGTPTIGSTKEEVGWLWLRIPEKRDVFFAQVVRVPLQQFGKESFAPIPSLSFGIGKAWIDGGKHEDFSVIVEGDNSPFEGYYTDELKGDFAGSYTVNIYLKLEV
jgi:hypothetical protein